MFSGVSDNESSCCEPSETTENTHTSTDVSSVLVNLRTNMPKPMPLKLKSIPPNNSSRKLAKTSCDTTKKPEDDIWVLRDAVDPSTSDPGNKPLNSQNNSSVPPAGPSKSQSSLPAPAVDDNDVPVTGVVIAQPQGFSHHQYGGLYQQPYDAVAYNQNMVGLVGNQGGLQQLRPPKPAPPPPPPRLTPVAVSRPVPPINSRPPPGVNAAAGELGDDRPASNSATTPGNEMLLQSAQPLFGGAVAAPASSQVQVWPLTQFYCVGFFVKISLICLEGNQ